MADEDVLKVVLLGDSGVGKSSIAQRIRDGFFNPNIVPTIGLDYALRRVPVGDRMVRVQIWDTAGQERFRSIASTYYRAGQITVLVFDASDPQQNLDYWHEQLRRHNTSTHVVAFANKRDLSDRLHHLAWCEQRGIPVFPMSARTGVGVEDAFQAMLRWASENRCLAPPPAAGPVVGASARSRCCGW